MQQPTDWKAFEAYWMGRNLDLFSNGTFIQKNIFIRKMGFSVWY